MPSHHARTSPTQRRSIAEHFRSFALLLFALTLASCGGGGGGGSGSATTATSSTVAPIIVAQPQSVSASDGQSVTFSVSAVGTAPLAYQWSVNGQPIAGATSASYTTSAQFSGSILQFGVSISNAFGVVQSASASLTVSPVAPAIANNTARTVSVIVGSPATFSVTVSGSLPLTFQWRRGGVAISGATTSTYTTPATTTSDNGAVFDVVVTNVAGTVTSAPFTLAVTVNPQAPTIATQPQPMTVRLGVSATFTVVAGGTGPFAYQWYRDGLPITGAQGASYTLSSAQSSDNNAQFSVLVTNAAGSISSNSVALTVLPLPGIALIAGDIGGSGSLDGNGTAARFAGPADVAIDNGGTLYVADGSSIRKVTAAGIVSTFAGSPVMQGTADGPAATATFASVSGVTVDPSGNVYVADTLSDTIRRIDTAGNVTTFAGTAGTAGSTDGTGGAALFNAPQGLASDSAGNLYVADAGNDTIRMITPAGVVTTLAGSPGVVGSADGTGDAAQFRTPYGLVVDGTGNLDVADTGNHTIRVVTPLGVVTTLAGDPATAGFADGVGAAATFNLPVGISADASGNLYVGDVGSDLVRKIAPGAVVTTVAGGANTIGTANGTGSAARFAYPGGVASNAAGVLFIADRDNFDVRRVSTTAVVTTFAGAPAIAGSADGSGTAAAFNLPFSIAVDAAMNVYVGDYQNATLRKITPAGVVTTLAGLAGVAGSADGVGSAARFATLQGIAVDSAGNVYVADKSNETIRKVTPAGVVTTIAGRPGVVGSADGTGSAATFDDPSAVTVDASGNIYVVDSNPTVRRITPAGIVTTIAGAAGRFGAVDGPGNVASFNSPQGVTVDANGTLYVTDATSSTIRKITSAGIVSTLAGAAGQTGTADGPAASARFTLPFGITIDPAGNLYVADIVPPVITIGTGGIRRTSNGNHTIRKIDTSGNVSTVAGVADQLGGVRLGALPGHFDALAEVAADSQGNIYATDENGVVRITFP